MENSHIGWTDHTFNPWEGCTKVSPGCTNCYAENRNKRFAGGVNWGKGAPRRRTSIQNWNKPIRWNQFGICGCCGEQVKQDHRHPAIIPAMRRQRVFSASLADWLDDEVPIEWLADLLVLVYQTPNLDWQLLTKRPENWYRRIDEALAVMEDCEWLESWLDCVDMPDRGDIPHNVWIGTTVENQEMADKRIPELLKIPASVRFLSCEPLLEKVCLGRWLKLQERFPCKIEDGRVVQTGPTTIHKQEPSKIFPDEPVGISWVIAGCESGPGQRTMRSDWATYLVNQCAAAQIPFFMKQMVVAGNVSTDPTWFPGNLQVQDFPEVAR